MSGLDMEIVKSKSYKASHLEQCSPLRLIWIRLQLFSKDTLWQTFGRYYT